MYCIKTPEQFVTTAWKNGLGQTTEMAISEGGTLDNFDWRISMATVNQDGEFSNFDGYHRQLILIKGQGISLYHQDPHTMEKSCDKLDHLLDIAEFDGGCATFGELMQGGIVDLNVMSKATKIDSQVTRITSEQELIVQTTRLLQIYAVTDDISIAHADETLSLKAGELFQWLTDDSKSLTLAGKNFIVIEFSSKS